MSENQPNNTNVDANAMLLAILQNESSPEVMRLRNLLLERVATETSLQPARVPAPTTITEIGGYYNLLKKDDLMRRQLLAAILGLPYQSK